MIFCGFILLITGYTAERVRHYLPHMYFLNRQQIATYEEGLIFRRVLNRVSKETRTWLIDVWMGKIPAEENFYQWIKDKYPKMNDEEVQKKYEELNG